MKGYAVKLEDQVMAGNTFGHRVKITTFGESHGEMTGVVIDGLPSRFKINREELTRYISRRKPGGAGTTARHEEDEYRIVSGIKDDVTLGTPVTILFENKSANPTEYEELKDVYRPGHADVTYDLKYGIRDENGGGRASGRETLSRVAAGGIVAQVLNEKGITVETEIVEIGGIPADDKEKISKLIDETKNAGDSLGGIIKCTIHGAPAGIGEPVFEKIDAVIASAVMSIGAVKGISFGEGFKSASMKGHEMNDPILEVTPTGIKTDDNHAGGILGGITTGEDIVFHVAVKPTPSISMEQRTVNKNNEPVTISIKGRHDTCIALRIGVVIESMALLAIINYMQ